MTLRRTLMTLLIVLVSLSTLVACSGSTANFKVGMVTDSGTIDDKSFNQGTWEGVVQAATELKIEKNYLKPSGTTEADYLASIGNLFDAGFKFIVCPGFKFSSAIFKAQTQYPTAKFVLIDAQPTDADGNAVVGTNTVAIFFAEHQSGFLAGVAAAVQLKTGEFGFIGGMEIPAVQRYNWGFQQGVKYANANLGTTITIKAENVIYQGTFSDVAGGQQLAATMFDKGVTAIFCAAGGVGVGAINEAKTRATQGKTAWIIGVDVDQFADGVYDTANNKSIILTSALKGIKTAAYDMIMKEKDGKFPGGQTLTFDASNDGVGIPATNPNLTAATASSVADVLKKLKAGTITVSDKQGDLIK
jgi:basic membrane protein A and related proteins